MGVLGLVLLAGCTPAREAVRQPLPSTVGAPASAPSGNFVLVVSNQSFARPLVDITIAIDGRQRVGQVFDVKGQHNWITFEFDLRPGPHSLHASSTAGDADLSQAFSTKGLQYALIDYWCCDPSLNEPRFTWTLSNTPFAFG